jgi:hypothetical protein
VIKRLTELRQQSEQKRRFTMCLRLFIYRNSLAAAVAAPAPGPGPFRDGTRIGQERKERTGRREPREVARVALAKKRRRKKIEDASDAQRQSSEGEQAVVIFRGIFRGIFHGTLSGYIVAVHCRGTLSRLHCRGTLSRWRRKAAFPRPRALIKPRIKGPLSRLFGWE